MHEPKKDYWERFLRAMNLIGPIEAETKEIKVEGKEKIELTPEQLIFIDRVANSLSYDPKMRRHFREGLKAVFEGKLDFNKWFDQTKVETGLHAVQLLKILYNSLEGLKGKEIKSLRESYKQAIQQLGGIV